MGFKREYLKHKVDEDNFPKKLSMRKSAKWGNCNWTPYIYRSPYYSSKWESLSIRILKFIKSHVGKDFNDTYAEFKKKFPTYFGSINLSECFKGRFREYQNREMNWENWSFYVDEEGIIRNGYVRKPKKKEIKVNILKKDVKYGFSNKVFEDIRIKFILEKYLPNNYLQYLEPNLTFSSKIYYNIKFYLSRQTNFALELAKLHTLEWWRKHGYCYSFELIPVWLKDKHEEKRLLPDHAIKKLIFDEYQIEEYNLIEVGSPECKRYFEDKRKQVATERRKAAKLREEQREILLHNIMVEKKRKEREEDIIARDRHGFDDESFKGEFYHGQKRKKK